MDIRTLDEIDREDVRNVNALRQYGETRSAESVKTMHRFRGEKWVRISSMPRCCCKFHLLIDRILRRKKK